MGTTVERELGNVAAVVMVVALVRPASHEELWRGSEVYRKQLEQATLLLVHLEDDGAGKEDDAVAEEALSMLPDLPKKPLAIWRRAAPEIKDALEPWPLPDALLLPFLHSSC